MPAEKTINQLYQDHYKSFSKNLEHARHLGQKDIHKLRVEIKNLRVLFKFLESLPGKKFKTPALLKLLKPVFKKAGQVRTQQLNLSSTTPYRSALMLRFKKHLQKEEEKAGRGLIKAIKHFNHHQFKAIHHENKKALQQLAPASIGKKSELYLRSMLASLRKDLFDLSSDEALHQVRKRLKTIKNMRQLLHEMDPLPALKNEISRTEKSYEALGNWHDGVVLAEAFENYIHKKEKVTALEKATELLLQLIEKNEKNKLLVIKKLRSDLA